MQATVVSMIQPAALAQPGVDTGAAPQVLAADAKRFASLVAVDPAAPSAAVASTAAVAPANAPANASLGDAILKRIDAAGQSYRNEHALVADALHAPSDSFSVQRMLEVQMRMADLSMQVDLFSKGVSKLLQHVDQLTKLQ